MHSAIRKITIILLLATLTACAATPGHVRQGKQVDEFNNQLGLALQGYDPVAYFKEGKPSMGEATLTYAWHGATYRFASVANRDAFAADPQRFAPQFGGYCAYAVSIGTTANGDPHQGVWVITHRDHKKLNVFDTSVPSAYQEWGPPLLPIIAPHDFCDVVTVQPAARSGGRGTSRRNTAISPSSGLSPARPSSMAADSICRCSNGISLRRAAGAKRSVPRDSKFGFRDF